MNSINQLTERQKWLLEIISQFEEPVKFVDVHRLYIKRTGEKIGANANKARCDALYRRGLIGMRYGDGSPIDSVGRHRGGIVLIPPSVLEKAKEEERRAEERRIDKAKSLEELRSAVALVNEAIKDGRVRVSVEFFVVGESDE